MEDRKVALLLERLLRAMKAALSESEDVVHIVEDMEACGVKVMLVVDAVIQPMDRALWPPMPPTPISGPQLQLTADDVAWLKNMRIDLGR